MVVYSDSDGAPYMALGGAVATGHADAIRLAREKNKGEPILLKLSGELHVDGEKTIDKVNETSGTAYHLMKDEPDAGHENDAQNILNFAPSGLLNPNIELMAHPSRLGASPQEAARTEHLDDSLISRHDAANHLNVLTGVLDFQIRSIEENQPSPDKAPVFDYSTLVGEIFPQDGPVRAEHILANAGAIRELGTPSAEGLLLKLEFAEMDADGKPILSEQDQRRLVVVLKPDLERAIESRKTESKPDANPIAESIGLYQGVQRNVLGIINLSKGMLNDGLISSEKQKEIESSLNQFEPGNLEQAKHLHQLMEEMNETLKKVDPRDHIQIIPLPLPPNEIPKRKAA